MRSIDTLVIGGGQAGLAMSHCLALHGIDHVVVERGRVGERWRSERWPTLRLLTPAWQTRLPGHRHPGPHAEAFMTMPEVVQFLDDYASVRRVPVEADCSVLDVSPRVDGYIVHTSRDTWRARSVVIATGHCDAASIPSFARHVSSDIHQLSPSQYKGPGSVPAGAVLVVGASSSGVQIADELQRAGRDVVISVGRHLRMPRRYRGRDILAWMEAMGLLSQRLTDTPSPVAARRQPSLQLVGDRVPRTLDLGILHDRGALVVGHLQSVSGHVARFDDDLLATTVAADAKLATLLARVDAFIATLPRAVVPAEPFEPLWPRFADAPRLLDLRALGVSAIVWATGFVRRYPWLHVPGALDEQGELVHEGGVMRRAGLYALGLQFQRRRNSAFIDGVGRDAEELAHHLALGLGAAAGGHAHREGVAS